MMNKKAQYSTMTRLAMVLIAGVAILGIFWIVAWGGGQQIRDGIEWMNVQVSEIGWGSDAGGPLSVDLYLVTQYKDLQTISAEAINCNRFVNFEEDDGFDLTKCPAARNYAQENCRQIDSACIYLNEEEYFEECQYRDRCDDCTSKNRCWEEDTKEYWQKRYVEQEIAVLVERCLRISDKSKERKVPCFTFTYDLYTDDTLDSSISKYAFYEGYDISYHRDWLLNREDYYGVVEYSESFYDSQELISELFTQEYSSSLTVSTSELLPDTTYLVRWDEATYILNGAEYRGRIRITTNLDVD